MANYVAEQMRVGDGQDTIESALRTVDSKISETAGVSIFHVLTLLSIIGSIALFLSGRRMEGIFVGLWPPTFQALKSATDSRG